MVLVVQRTWTIANALSSSFKANGAKVLLSVNSRSALGLVDYPGLSAASEQREKQGADDGKDPAAKSLGSRGGKARAKALDSKRRSEIAKLGAAARWKRD